MMASRFTAADHCAGRGSSVLAIIASPWRSPIAGLFADGETIVQDAQCVHESYPDFGRALDDFINPKRARMTTPVISSLTALEGR